MTPKEKSTLVDLASYILLSVLDDAGHSAVLSTVGHDVRGLLEKDRFFLPRTSGFKKRLTEREAATGGRKMGR